MPHAYKARAELAKTEFLSIFLFPSNIPIILSPHGGLEKRRLKSIKKILYSKFIQKSILKSCSYVHALTKFEEKDIISFQPNTKTVVIPNGVKLPIIQKFNRDIRNQYTILDNSIIILYLGRLHKEKGIGLLIQSFLKIKDRYNDWVLVIAGPDKDNYKKKLDKKKYL